jgi:hypothetical protein
MSGKELERLRSPYRRADGPDRAATSMEHILDMLASDSHHPLWLPPTYQLVIAWRR